MTEQRTFRIGRFTIDDAAVFEGWTDGSDWNGWACPYFEVAEAQKIAAYHGGRFDEASREFTFQANSEEPESYAAETIEAGGRQVEAWPIGSTIWIWDEVSKL